MKEKDDNNGRYKTHKFNPYVEDVFKKIKSSSVSVTSGGDEVEIYSKKTGEFTDGVQTIVRRHRVDTEQFIKVYNNQIGKLFDMSAKSTSVLKYIFRCLLKDKDYFYFNYKDCLEFTEYTSRQVVYRGLCELIDNGIIAKTESTNKFWINPTVFFNGNRLLVVDEYVCNMKEEFESNDLLD